MSVRATLVIKELIDKKGMTQKELAAMSGMTQAAVSRLARGFVDRVDIDQLSRIATALEITDMNELIRLEEHD